MPQVTLSTTANPAAITPNAKRFSLDVTNLDSAIVVYLKSNAYNPGLTVTSSNAEYPIGPGLTRSWQVPIHGRRITKSAFQAIAASGTPVIQWSEGYDSFS